MNIYGMEKLSLVDFDSYTTCTLFTAGCNFACPFCHNSSLVQGKDLNKIDTTYIFDYLKKRKHLLDAVCITGGEPTLNKDLPEFIASVKELGYIVKLDTNGANPTMLLDLIKNNLVDYVAMDIKNSLEKYPQTCGVKNVDTLKIKESIDILLSNAVNYEFRTTLVKQFHTEQDMLDISKLIKGAKKYCLQQFVGNENCIDTTLCPIDKDTAQTYADLLKTSIKEVLLRGY
ncbi:MAG: anaerobic ribonucleoside-triphosphate reductase activating protein [Clostridia bacterium]